MLDFGFYNMDCMEGMKQFPDKYFDLAIVDPPYGDGGAVEAARQKQIRRNVRPLSTICTQANARERERERRSHEQAERGRASSAKKSFRGTQPRSKTILKNCFVSHVTKLFGGAIIFGFRLHGAFLFGEKQMFPKISQWLCVNMRGHLSTTTPKCLSFPLSDSQTDFIQHKSQLSYTSGSSASMLMKATRYSTLMSGAHRV